MGAVPVAYESIVDLSTIHCEEIDMDDGTAYRFLPTADKSFPNLTSGDQDILDVIIRKFGKFTKNEIVETMHREDAYTKTAPHDIIDFKYALALSLS